MADQSPSERLKAEMAQIPGGVGTPGSRPSGSSTSAAGMALWAGGLALVVLVAFLGARAILRGNRPEPVEQQPAPQIVVPTPASEALPPPAVSTEAQPGIATLEELATPWSSKSFFFRNRVSGEKVPAIIVRLPGGAGSQASSYWAFALPAPFGRCQIEYVEDLQKLATDYGFRAKHPMAANPCTRTIFDPLRMMNLPGKVWVRGAMVQGSDIRPPLSIEIKIEGQQIQAVRME